MARLRNAVIVLMMICIGLQIVACTTLALSGDKRYKTEINTLLLDVQHDFDKDGGVAAGTLTKMEKLLTKYEKDYGQKGSYMRFKEMHELVKKAEADPNNAFNIYREALAKKAEVEGYLLTEVKE